MNNENNNGVIDFDSSSFLNNNSNNEVPTPASTSASDASNINVDDIFGTWSNDEPATQDVVKPISNDYNNSDIVGSEEEASSNNEVISHPTDIFATTFENTTSSLGDSNSNGNVNTDSETVTFEVNPASLSSNPGDLNSQVTPEVSGSQEVTPSFDANAGSFEEANSFGTFTVQNSVSGDSAIFNSQDNQSIETNPIQSSVSSQEVATPGIEFTPSENTTSSFETPVNLEENNSLLSQTVADNPVSMEASATGTSSLQEALSMPTNTNTSIENVTPNTFNSQINPDIQAQNTGINSDFSDTAATSEPNLSFNNVTNESSIPNNQGALASQTTQLENKPESQSIPNNTLTLDNSVSIGTVPASQVDSNPNTVTNSNNNSEDSKTKKKINLPVIMLVLIIVISVAIIIFRRDVLIDFFQTLLNK